MLAPIVVFAFNRPDVLKNTLEALCKNPLAEESDLYIYVDGPRHEQDAVKVAVVREIVESVAGFKTITRRYSECNKGLATSIIDGVSEIIDRYGMVIVVEDDLIVSPSFITYMNAMLTRYKENEMIFQISGFGLKLHIPRSYKYDVYACKRARSWGWATWKDRWEKVDWSVSDYAMFRRNYYQRFRFNRAGSDLCAMLWKYMHKKNNSWYIRFMYTMFKEGKYCITPFRSLVKNEGFSVEATHCNNYNRYKIDFASDYCAEFHVPSHFIYSRYLNVQNYMYYSYVARLYGKIRTVFMK